MTATSSTLAAHLDELRVAERTADELEQARLLVHASGRLALGIGEGAERASSSLAGRAGVGLGVASSVPLVVLLTLAQELDAGLGAGPAALTGLAALPLLAAAAGALPAVALGRRSRRGALALAAVAAGVTTLAAAASPGLLSLTVLLAAAGAASGALAATSLSVLADLHPPPGRASAFGALRAGELLGVALVLVSSVALIGAAELTWRAVLAVLGELVLVTAFLTHSLAEPPPGGRDEVLVRQAVVPDVALGALSDADLGPAEHVRRVLAVPSVRRLLVAYAVLGLATVPLLTYLLYYLDERWRLDFVARGTVTAAMLGVALVAVLLAVRPLTSLATGGPRLVLASAGAEVVVGMLALGAGALAPFVALAATCFAIAIASLAMARPALDTVLHLVVPPASRPWASALAVTATTLAAGLGGTALFAGMDRRFGPGGALVVLALVGAQAVTALRAASRTVEADLDRVVENVVERAEIDEIVQHGRRLPMLSCRHVDFSYGPLQVLFDVDFTIDDGEMVALLGTNGAGKSTLLRVVSGLGTPSAGTVRFRGEDITFIDAERRMRLGISQVPGGRGVYGPLTVVENLRVLGYSHGRDRRAVSEGIDAVFEAFPRLAERRNQLAGTLSGGEQQMLSLSRAYMVRPRLLLIDELSLGLAPKIVGELLDMVRRINAAGTAVVVVEQSVNVALSLVEHAYFMEKGEVRFDGAAPELLARPDLLRSVFLEGAASQGRGDG